ncbi:MAG: hypothetical protein PVG60_03085 [Desulfarculaceae bacterium]|jgi:hypothetical protein
MKVEEQKAVQVRFMESGRGRQTPTAINLGAGWEPVRLLAEELVAGTDPQDPYQRRFLVQTAQGRRLVLVNAKKAWQVRPIPPVGD